jgi:hypothetical protein
MTRSWNNPDRAPTPAELTAWADGELDPADAARVEEWLCAHPEAQGEVDSSSRLLGLFRDHPAPEPSPAAWDATLERIAARTRRRSRWQALLFVTLTAASLLIAVIGAGLMLPGSADVNDLIGLLLTAAEDDEPFPVASLSEVNILHMDARDAHRVLMGQPLLEPFEVVGSDDIELVSVEADPEDGSMPELVRGARFPMVVVARADDEP